jgi:hypothetical protein
MRSEVLITSTTRSFLSSFRSCSGEEDANYRIISNVRETLPHWAAETLRIEAVDLGWSRNLRDT